MPMLDGLRKLFRRDKPVEIDIDSSDAAGPVDGEAGLATVERRPPSGGKRSMAELQRGYDEVMGLVRKIGDHLDAQTDRTEKLIELMERLPPALDALPEISRHNARLLEMLNDHLSQGKRREDALNDTLGRLSESSSQQTEVLGLVQQHFDAAGRTSEQMSQTLGAFSETLSNLAANNGRSAELLTHLSETAEQRESTIIDMMRRTQRWMIAAILVVGALAVGAVIFAVVGMMR